MRFAVKSDLVARALIVAKKETGARLGVVESYDHFAQRFAMRQRHRDPRRQFAFSATSSTRPLANL